MSIKRILFLIIIFNCCFLNTKATTINISDSLIVDVIEITDSTIKEAAQNQYNENTIEIASPKNIKSPENLPQLKSRNRAAAISLTILTGLIGGHRVYLGCKPYIPVIYAITLGGGLGILPFIDLIVICISKDLEQYENNDRIFMWAN